MFAPNWYWRTEYRLAYYGNQVLTDTNGAGLFVNNINFKPIVQTITTQLVYKYNPGIPGAVTEVSTPSAGTSWTGVYLSGGGGYGLWAADTSVTAVPGSGNPALPFKQRQGGRGYLGVVGGGFDYQFAPRLVAGAFAEFDISGLKGTIQDQGASLAGDLKETSAWAAGIRGGWLISPDILSFVNAGYTNAHFASTPMINTATSAPSGFSTPAFSTGGYFIGAGIEAALAAGWFWRTEYRLSYYGNQTRTDTNGAGLFVNSINFKPTMQTAISQLVYKFNWTRQVVGATRLSLQHALAIKRRPEVPTSTVRPAGSWKRNGLGGMPKWDGVRHPIRRMHCWPKCRNGLKSALFPCWNRWDRCADKPLAHRFSAAVGSG